MLNDDLYNQNPQDSNFQMQKQLELDIQLYQKRQLHYNNIFERVFNKLNEYIALIQSGKVIPNEKKGALLDLLDYYAGVVKLWNQFYPNHEPLLKNGFDKKAILDYFSKLIKDETTDKNDAEIYKKFYCLLNGKEQKYYEDKVIESFFQNNNKQATKEDVFKNAFLMISTKDELDKNNKTIEQGGYKDYNIDPNLNYLKNDFS